MPLVIPGRERPKTIDVMTTVELGEVIGGLVTRPAPIRPIGKLVQGFRHRVAGLDAVADEIVRRKDEIDEELAGTLVDELMAVVDEIKRAFG